MTEAEVRQHVGLLFASGTVIEGRYCHTCRSDLADEGTPTAEGAGSPLLKGAHALGRSPLPQGGHAPGCAAARLLRWAQGAENVYTRERP